MGESILFTHWMSAMTLSLFDPAGRPAHEDLALRDDQPRLDARAAHPANQGGSCGRWAGAAGHFEPVAVEVFRAHSTPRVRV